MTKQILGWHIFDVIHCSKPTDHVELFRWNNLFMFTMMQTTKIEDGSSPLTTLLSRLCGLLSLQKLTFLKTIMVFHHQKSSCIWTYLIRIGLICIITWTTLYFHPVNGLSKLQSTTRMTQYWAAITVLEGTSRS